ncbi:Hypothetical protein BFF96_0611 [Corynebacterium pseudotuberculosis]|nr:Hypothetical protein BFF96_0611 [Corynebacterium pseudotuberculosis]
MAPLRRVRLRGIRTCLRRGNPRHSPRQHGSTGNSQGDLANLQSKTLLA